jgi:mono/diheme cytochrome c family protein
VRAPTLLIALSCSIPLSLAPAVPARAAAEEPPPVSEDYLLHCSACHGLDGKGTPGVTPSLHEAGALLATPEGRDYLSRVPGVAQAPLSDERLARLLNFVLTRYAATEPSPAYSANEVGALRQRPLRDPVAARQALATGQR